jgi:hypothetical protein
MSEVGWNSFEEINVLDTRTTASANFGWPFYEGGANGNLQTPGYFNRFGAGTFYTDAADGFDAIPGVSGPGAPIVAPVAGFGHSTAEPGFSLQAIVGAVVVDDVRRYPQELAGRFLFGDLLTARLFSVDTDDRRDIAFLGRTDGVLGPVHLMQGPDGFIYFAELGGRNGFDNDGLFGRLLITKPGAPPVEAELVNGSFETTPAPVAAGQAVSFAAIAGWTAIAGGSIEVREAFSGVTASDGAQYVQLDDGAGVDGFFQDVRTAAGQDYALTFDLRRSKGLDGALQQVEVLWNGERAALLTPGSLAWVEQRITVTGTGGNDRLTIRELASQATDGRGALLDDFRLDEVPATLLAQGFDL